MSLSLRRSARGRINQHPCVFAQPLQQHAAVCSLVVHQAGQPFCSQPVARAHCARLEGFLQETLRFALKDCPASQLMARSLAALNETLETGTHAVDVQCLLERLEARGGLGELPVAALLRRATTTVVK